MCICAPDKTFRPIIITNDENNEDTMKLLKKLKKDGDAYCEMKNKRVSLWWVDIDTLEDMNLHVGWAVEAKRDVIDREYWTHDIYEGADENDDSVKPQRRYIWKQCYLQYL
jgi:hypothetical protein